MSEPANANDLELLARYTRHHAEDAFATLVRRHVDLVHSAALRQVRSPQLAEEVAQTTFTKLARIAPQLAPDTILTAWLYQVTRREAIDVVRREARRQLREQIATELNTMNATTADWAHIEPILDEAMAELDDTDRAAVLLRYFENKSLREVGATLGTSDDAAQKRVGRALEKLRVHFSKRGMVLPAAALPAAISANAVQAAPVGLALTISTAAALTGTTLATATTATAIKTIAMTTLQKTVITATLAIVAGVGIYEARQNSQLREQNQMLQQERAPLTEQIQKLQRERDEAANRLSALADEIQKVKGGSSELLRLRGEVSRLRRVEQESLSDPIETAAKSWKNRVTQLKQRLEQTPESQIPELKFLEEKDWLAAVKDHQLDSDVQYRRALSALRSAGESKFAGLASTALQKYAAANNGQFPTDLAQLKSYFDSPLDDAIFQRWQITSAKAVPNVGGLGDTIITEKAAVDDMFDQRIVLGLNGSGSTDFLSLEIQDKIDPLCKAFTAANNGKTITDPSQLLPYATTTEQQAAVQKLIQRIKLNSE